MRKHSSGNAWVKPSIEHIWDVETQSLVDLRNHALVRIGTGSHNLVGDVESVVVSGIAIPGWR